MLQLTVNKGAVLSGRGTRAPQRSLKDLKRGEHGVLDRLNLPEDMSRRLMELGFLPGACVVAACSAPGGDPKVYRVDGSEIALRKDTASQLFLRSGSDAKPSENP